MLLDVQDLTIQISADGGATRFDAVQDVAMQLDHGRTLALVGESGCGKSLTALAIVGLLPPAARARAGRILMTDGAPGGRANAIDILTLPPTPRRKLAGSRIGMIFQEPMSSLNPVLTIGSQIAEPLRLHRRLGRAAAKRRAIELLEQVGLARPAERYHDYPHRLSGGMRQRVMIAIAVACEPALLIADEPTTALDVTIEAQVLSLLREIQQRRGMAMLFISHDLGLVERIADDVAVMYAGRIVERGARSDVLARPLHPYTRGLLQCTPRLSAPANAADPLRRGEARPPYRFATIPGEMLTPGSVPAGCAFEARCSLGAGDATCRSQRPDLREDTPAHVRACWKS